MHVFSSIAYIIDICCILYIPVFRAANYCRTSDNVRLNLANVRAKVILIGHWSDHKKNCHIHFFSLRRNGYIQTCLVTYIYLATYICPTN